MNPAEITATRIMEVMDRIISRQREELVFVYAFFLDAPLIPVIAPHLTEDDPLWAQSPEIEYHRPEGLVGRYRSVAVILKDPIRDSEFLNGTEEFVEFAFIKVDAIF